MGYWDDILAKNEASKSEMAAGEAKAKREERQTREMERLINTVTEVIDHKGQSYFRNGLGEWS